MGNGIANRMISNLKYCITVAFMETGKAARPNRGQGPDKAVKRGPTIQKTGTQTLGRAQTRHGQGPDKVKKTGPTLRPISTRRHRHGLDKARTRL